MAINIPGVTMVGTKLTADGNFQLVFQNPNGGVRFCFVMTAAQMTTLSGLGSGASTTIVNAQDLYPTDYPAEYVGI